VTPPGSLCEMMITPGGQRGGQARVSHDVQGSTATATAAAAVIDDRLAMITVAQRLRAVQSSTCHRARTALSLVSMYPVLATNKCPR